jgi:hypothetical protein
MVVILSYNLQIYENTARRMNAVYFLLIYLVDCYPAQASFISCYKLLNLPHSPDLAVHLTLRAWLEYVKA